MNLKEIGWEDANWIELSQWQALFNTVMNLQVL